MIFRRRFLFFGRLVSSLYERDVLYPSILEKVFLINTNFKFLSIVVFSHRFEDLSRNDGPFSVVIELPIFLTVLLNLSISHS